MIRAAIGVVFVLFLCTGCAHTDESQYRRGKGSVRWVLDDEAAKLTPEAHADYWSRWAWKMSPQPASRCPVIDQAAEAGDAWERGLSR